MGVFKKYTFLCVSGFSERESPPPWPPLLCENNTYRKEVVEMVSGGRGLWLKLVRERRILQKGNEDIFEDTEVSKSSHNERTLSDSVLPKWLIYRKMARKKNFEIYKEDQSPKSLLW